ncbi:peroxiredoxin family protein [Chryseobacterium sp. Bi04]|uniref:peroxiredoxin family protein n=1 Tax=Chryseobacterium sp. Bi04 TaxID=2822345 RepID=UPI001D73CF16|nr:peroxiredoxin family protein [Chryseobacterium sp. Bi04]CAH0272741.1 Thiol-disulfide oxidoreductase ResA [Chryseobacterium sp. Bi04]
MKKLLLFLSVILLSACQSKKEESTNTEDLQKMREEWIKNRLDFFQAAQPKYFSAKTINGHSFNSKDYQGKNLLIFIYSKTFLKKDPQASYNMVDDFNGIHARYKDHVGVIGIVEGLVDTDKELQQIFHDAHFPFEQIDNTQSPGKPEQLKYNIYCTPAKILINSNGKVIHSSCGGATDEELIRKLDSIKSAPKEL